MLMAKHVLALSQAFSLSLLAAISMSSAAGVLESHVKSKAELEHGLVLYDYFQQQYFDALVEDAVANAIGNSIAKSDKGQLLQGGLMLSYGMADDSRQVFERLLDANAPEVVRNRAWYYLGKFYYNKSDFANSARALNKIEGQIPKDLHFDYHYLTTLVRTRSGGSMDDIAKIEKSLVDMPQYPYFVFNLGIGQLRSGNLVSAVRNLEKVANAQSTQEEYIVLADRAKLGLAQLAMQKGLFDDAWTYLTQIRTTGLYSNRALLNYGWAAIKIKRYPDAIAALKLLNERDIASPEVQEAKVLLAHLYEQEGSPRKALKANLLSIKDFQAGVEKVAEARRIIAKKDVPEELITNMESIMDDSDWNSARPDVDYKNLTPFLIDLMSSNPFNETLKELADLYSLRKNLHYWLTQADQHLIIMDSATKKAFDERSRALVKTSSELHQRYSDKKDELNLLNLTLEVPDQERVDILLTSTGEELGALAERINTFSTLEGVYTLPSSYRPEVAELHQRIKRLLQKTELNIVKLEPVMRELVNAELDKHEERMNYYWAQSRLAKARLYDTTLSTLRDAQRAVQEEQGDESDNNVEDEE